MIAAEYERVCHSLGYHRYVVYISTGTFYSCHDDKVINSCHKLIRR